MWCEGGKVPATCGNGTSARGTERTSHKYTECVCTCVSLSHMYWAPPKGLKVPVALCVMVCGECWHICTYTVKLLLQRAARVRKGI